jgi:hypothetical protein
MNTEMTEVFLRKPNQGIAVKDGKQHGGEGIRKTHTGSIYGV